MPNKIYKLELISENPSADKNGFFLTKEELELCVEKYKKIVSEHTEHYGNVKFEITEINTGESYFD